MVIFPAALVRSTPPKARQCTRTPMPASRATVALTPGAAQAHGNLANTLRRLGRVDDALAHYQRALTLAPGARAAEAVDAGDPAARVLLLPGQTRSSYRWSQERPDDRVGALLTGDQEFNSAKTLSAFGLGLTLFLVTLALNIVAHRIVQTYREQYD